MPIELTLEPHNESWTCDFEHEAAAIRRALGSNLSAIHHIGSTSIPGIHAKPIIDILPEILSLETLDSQTPLLESLGYETMGEFGIPTRRYFRKDNSSGTRTHHLHAFTKDSPHITRHLAFRDYLRAHSAIARNYNDLKLHLLQTSHGDIDLYMDGKDSFIKSTEQTALLWYQS